MEPGSPALQADSLLSEPPGKPIRKRQEQFSRGDGRQERFFWEKQQPEIGEPRSERMTCSSSSQLEVQRGQPWERKAEKQRRLWGQQTRGPLASY